MLGVSDSFHGSLFKMGKKKRQRKGTFLVGAMIFNRQLILQPAGSFQTRTIAPWPGELVKQSRTAQENKEAQHEMFSF